MSLLRIVSILSLFLAFACSAIIMIDIVRGHWQKMAIMNWVWPITAIWSGPMGLWAYFHFGRTSNQRAQQEKQPGSRSNRDQQHDEGPKSKDQLEREAGKPFWQITTVGDLHCAAGCTLGDFVGEWIVFLTGLVIAGSVLWSDYLLDFAMAYTAGIVFQYYAIAPRCERGYVSDGRPVPSRHPQFVGTGRYGQRHVEGRPSGRWVVIQISPP